MSKIFLYIIVLLTIFSAVAFADNIILHRTVRDCATNNSIDFPIGHVDNRPGVVLNYENNEQIVDLSVFRDGHYYNYMCAPRYQEQCIYDGSFDMWYDEWCEERTESFDIALSPGMKGYEQNNDEIKDSANICESQEQNSSLQKQIEELKSEISELKKNQEEQKMMLQKIFDFLTRVFVDFK